VGLVFFLFEAKNSQTLVFIIRAPNCVEQSLALSLRMKLYVHDDGLNIDIFKRQHGWPIEPFTLNLKNYWPPLFGSTKTEFCARQDSNIILFPAAGER